MGHQGGMMLYTILMHIPNGQHHMGHAVLHHMSTLNAIHGVNLLRV